MVQANELLAKVRERKRQLEESKARAKLPIKKSPTKEPPAKKPNPYISLEKPESRVKPVIPINQSPFAVQFIENEAKYTPTPPDYSFYNQFLEPIDLNAKYIVYPPPPPPVIHVPLTPNERKRQLKNAREQKIKDQQTQVKLGLQSAPPPKLTLSNVQAVIGTDFIKDPTKYEMMARTQMEQRKQQHIEDNEQRKLTDDQKWLKKMETINEHKQQDLTGYVVRIFSKLTAKQVASIDSMSKSNLFTGCLILNDSSLLIIEGGKPEIQRFKRKLDKLFDDPNLEIWEGKIHRAAFSKWTVHSFPNSFKFLKNHGLETLYWLDKDLVNLRKHVYN